MLLKRLIQYLYLMRLNQPIGILLLLWPTLWGLCLASSGKPDKKILFIFLSGVIIMRSAGCIINDLIDRRFDAEVTRTRARPLVSGQVSSLEAIFLASILLMSAGCLVMLCNALTIQLAFIGAGLTIIYPFMKRFTYLPQVGLGVTFTWGLPMAFAACTGKVESSAWFLYATCILWPVIYDTMYAMVDREDDLKIGVKSTAILFNHHDVFIISSLQILFILMLILSGKMFHLNSFYYLSLLISAMFFTYQYQLIKERDRQKCFKAFLNNNWIGCTIFIGIMLAVRA